MSNPRLATIGGLQISPNPATLSNSITLTATGVTGASRVIFYWEIDGDNVLSEGDIDLFQDVSAPYTVTYPAGSFSPGTHRFYARATDSNGVDSNVVTNVLTVLGPMSGSLAGTVWNDIDGDGVQDVSEGGLSGWTVYLDQNANGVKETAEVSTLSAVDGSYSFGGLGAGIYVVSQVLEPDYENTHPGVSPFEIEVVYPDASLTASQKEIFNQAAARWSEIIVGDLPDVSTTGGLVDDLRITAEAAPIDGPFGTLGQAGPDSFRSSGGLPITGRMFFDTADLSRMEADGSLYFVILHEMGHVLGIGTLWQSLGLITGSGTSDPRYTGSQAVAQYNSIFGVTGNSLPLENTGGSGTRDSHWRESVLGSELMTGFADSPPMPLSKVTVGGLADLGYLVNYQAADPYTAPAALQGSPAAPLGRFLPLLGPHPVYDPLPLPASSIAPTHIVYNNGAQALTGLDFGNRRITAPEINVRGNGVSIVDGDLTPSTADGTDFGSSKVNESVGPRVFTIENTGIDDLILQPVNITGAAAANFVVVTQPASVVPPGGSTTFSLTFTPSATGARNATVSIANNDRNENPYNFSLTGLGLAIAPEINVVGNGAAIADGDGTPSAADGTDFGSVAVGQSVGPRVFTVENTGVDPLTLGTVTVSGTNANEFVVTAQPAGPVAPGSSTTFTITFTPTAAGTRTAAISFSNNDANENPYNFSLAGTAVAVVPEMNVLGAGVTIVDGDTSPSTADDTDFSSAKTGQPVVHTFTIQNTGIAPLNLSGNPPVVVGGTNAADFVVTAQPTGPVAPGESTTFTVTFTPSAIGSRTATLSIANNDANENPYNFSILGTGAASISEIDIQFAGTTIVDGDTTPSATEGTLFGPTTVGTPWGPQTFTIRNTGVDPLTLGTVTVAGTNAAEFAVVTQPSTPVAPGESTTFSITFTPTAAGTRTATLSIANNDGNENPYNFSLSGTALALAPEMDLQGTGGVSIVDGDTSPSTADGTEFGSSKIGQSVGPRSFTIRNLGTTPLNLTGTPLVVVGGTGAADFTVVTPPVGTVAPGESTSFEVTFTPTAAGLRSATLTIANNDANENPYNFSVQGTGTALVPEIGVLGPTEVAIADGDTTPAVADGTDFGPTTVTSSLGPRTFTIQNTGVDPLTLGTVTLTGTNAADFAVTTQPVGPVPPGGSATFSITFSPSGTGLRSASLSFSNNDANENPYNFSLQGTGLALAPEMNVSANGLSIVDGDTGPSTTDGTDFGSSKIGRAVGPRNFTIENTGTTPLNLTGSPLVTISGTAAADFVVVVPPNAVVAPGGVTSFEIVFTPSATGLRSATLTIANNDANENPYNFSIQGTGLALAPEIDVQGNGISLADGDLSPSTTDGTDFGSWLAGTSQAPRTFTIFNTGIDPLTLGSVTLAGTNAADFAVSTPPAGPVPPGGSTTLAIVFTPAATGLRTATLSFANNDANENPFNFSIQGTGLSLAPEIDVRGNGVTIADGDTSPATADGTDFGLIKLGLNSGPRTFTIWNVGTTPLDLTGNPLVAVSGAQAADYAVTKPPAPTVAPGASTTFEITFTPSATGARTATLTIANGDANENPYNFSLTGTGATTVAEIDVQGSGVSIADGDTTPSPADGTSFGSVAIGSPAAITYTVFNSGVDPLTLGPVTVSGTNAAEFVVEAQPAGSVAPGASTTFTVRFTPTAAGARTATLSLANNDANENPYNFSVNGTGLALVPEIDVRGNDVSIVDGDASPATADGTSFGSVVIGAPSSVTYWVWNTGIAPLTLGTVAVSGTNAAEFVVTEQPPGPVAPGNSAAFTVRFTPTAAGPRSAALSLSNNDANENPYNFSINGTGVTPAPEIDVRWAGTSIFDGDTTPSTSEGTSFGVVGLGYASELEYLIQNTGTLPLTLGTVAISGTNAAEFVVTHQPVGPVAPGGSTPFRVTFTPTALGPRSASLSFSDNDANENPYNFSLAGTGAVAAPEIALWGGEVPIIPGDATPSASDGTAWPAVAVGQTSSHPFQVGNQGTGNLTLTGTPLIAVTGEHAADFSVTAIPPAALVPGQSSSFEIAFSPRGRGLRTATITIASDDSNENPFTFRVQGTGVAPEINVFAVSAHPISDGDTTPSTLDSTDLGSLPLGMSTRVLFTIENLGELPLDLDPLIVTNPAQFGSPDVLPASLAPGQQTTFHLDFAATAVGLQSTTVIIPNSDPAPGRASFDFVVQAQVVGTALVGDANGDGSVGAADYAIWAAQFGQTGTGLAADFDENGSVGAGDYALWAANFGRTEGGLVAPPAAPLPVEVLPAGAGADASLRPVGGWSADDSRRTAAVDRVLESLGDRTAPQPAAGRRLPGALWTRLWDRVVERWDPFS